MDNDLMRAGAKQTNKIRSVQVEYLRNTIAPCEFIEVTVNRARCAIGNLEDLQVFIW